MALVRRLLLIAISVQAFPQGPNGGCAEESELEQSTDVSLLQLNGVLKAIESVLDFPTDADGHPIHTPNGPRVAHMSHLPVQAAIPDQSASALLATRDESHEAVASVDENKDDPHLHTDPHADPAAPPPDPHAETPHTDAPVPGEAPQDAPTHSPGDPHHVLPGYENAHPADLSKEKYEYLDGLAAFAIGPGMFFLGLLAITTFGLFFYAYKNDPRVFC
jgi:hypothetical protein